MEKYRCKLCLRKFVNGRALGGHMRSHMMNLHVTPKKKERQQKKHEAQDDDDDQQEEEQQQLSGEFVQVVPSSTSCSSPSSSEEDEDEDEDEDEEENDKNGHKEKDLSCYCFKGNPKKSIHLIDPTSSLAVDEAGSVVLQDRESETESSKNQNCRRSTRVRRSTTSEAHHQCSIDGYAKRKIPKCTNAGVGKVNESSSSFVEPEPVSSISNTTPEEDVAYCLMMLSRDKWVIEKEEEDGDDYDEEERKKCIDDDDDDDDDLNEKDYGVGKVTKARSTRGNKYRCETCNKVFRSYQALGGHRASHKKIKLNNVTTATTLEASQVVMKRENAGGGDGGNVVVVVAEKIHECPVCYRVFSSGQALGGHKRSHGSAIAANASVVKPISRMIDLNLPASLEDDDNDDEGDEISQMELSVVFD